MKVQSFRDNVTFPRYILLGLAVDACLCIVCILGRQFARPQESLLLQSFPLLFFLLSLLSYLLPLLLFILPLILLAFDFIIIFSEVHTGYFAHIIPTLLTLVFHPSLVGPHSHAGLHLLSYTLLLPLIFIISLAYAWICKDVRGQPCEAQSLLS